MPGKIPKYFINDILYRTDIVELINTRIKLTKYGKDYHSHCPFHNDKNPSFTVSHEKQFYYCFGCNAHGNAIDFLMHYENLNFIETIEELSIIHGVKIPCDNINKKTNFYVQKQKSYSLIKQISELYQKNIILSHSAKKYLSERGINQKMIDLFSIGFSSCSWKNFSNKLNISKESEQELLNYKILSINKNGYTYDRFQGRLIFPIQDKYGRILGFGGRSTQNISPKYLNSPETDIFHKRKQIYGLYQVKKQHSNPKYLLVVEGYIDVITLTQHNINYVVSSLGTLITSEHIHILFQITDTVIYCYDGDDAGKNAAWRALKISLPYISDKKTVKFILLPDNQDPDVIIRQEGQEKFQIRINNAMTMSKFFFKHILKNINLSSEDDKFHLSTRALPLIDTISSDTIRIYLRQILARMIGILDDDQLEKFLYEKEIKKNQPSYFYIKRTSMRTLIGLLIQNPHLATKVPSLIEFKNANIEGLPIFLEILQTCINNPNVNTGQLLEIYRNSKIINILKILSRWDHMIIQEEIQNMFLDLLINIYNKILEKKREYLLSKERIQGLNINEKKEIWSINKKLSKK